MKILTILALGAATLGLGLPLANVANGQTARMRANHAEAVQDQIHNRVADRAKRRATHAEMVQDQIQNRVANRSHRRAVHARMVQNQIERRVDRREDRPY